VVGNGENPPKPLRLSAQWCAPICRQRRVALQRRLCQGDCHDFVSSMGLTPKVLLCGLVALASLPLCAQDLAPRTYVITPVGFNAITLTWSYFNGGVHINGAIPIRGATGIFNISSFTYYRSFGFLDAPPILRHPCHMGSEIFREGSSNRNVQSIVRGS